ncbi:hypothetical protein SSS_07891 [Sarcoptes scabiei]|uniref:Methyltransferase-like protein 13 n=1 Tax=Sarcoptes scabiei TaxID=52283 RepID=A0A132AB28_SARSC|nr:hypothetical protein SSS_07891 [Sarcoptes scabiei]KPM08079.1 methyltransferase-like protein 13-like protein [Sarcoptes scabiei]UXI21201.1 RPII140-upstream gene protein [Sarcoptes scabiei]
MSILPKSSKEFATKKYWDQFFRKHRDPFEWYGDYEDLKPILSKYLKKTDSFLVIGCGNSTLSVDLYDDGYCDNTSIDISEFVIEKMNKKYKTSFDNQQKQSNIRERLHFECMDMFEMKTIEDESFHCIIDKGTFDAVASDQLDSEKLFDELSRVLKYSGRYICISLLQENVLRILFKWFHLRSNWICRVHRCLIRKNSSETDHLEDHVEFPVFVIVFIKMRMQLSSNSIEFNLDWDPIQLKFEKFSSIEDFAIKIKAIQDLEFLKYFIRSNKIEPNENLFLELYNQSNPNDWRYLFHFVCKNYSNQSKQSRKFFVFIVPQGREHEWLFSSVKGRQQLLQQCQGDKMIVVSLNRKHHYENMEAIKNELADKVLDFFPNKYRNGTSNRITFISIGDDIGQRTLIWEGRSEINGMMFVEDIVIEKEKYRRLVFAQNRNLIQSEAKLIEDKKSARSKTRIDHQFLSCNYHQLIAISLSITQKPISNRYRLLMIGLGGGNFINFLTSSLKINGSLELVVVEIDPMIEEVARKYFDFGKNPPENIEIKIILQDGLDYLSRSIGTQKFDFIIFDVDSKNNELGLSCPPEPFVKFDCLKRVQSNLTENGLFILNLVCRDGDIKKKIHEKIRSIFKNNFFYDIEDDLNEIVIATDSDQIDWLKRGNSDVKFDLMSKSCFYIDRLESTCRKFCKGIRCFN